MLLFFFSRLKNTARILAFLGGALSEREREACSLLGSKSHSQPRGIEVGVWLVAENQTSNLLPQVYTYLHILEYICLYTWPKKGRNCEVSRILRKFQQSPSRCKHSRRTNKPARDFCTHDREPNAIQHTVTPSTRYTDAKRAFIAILYAHTLPLSLFLFFCLFGTVNRKCERVGSTLINSFLPRGDPFGHCHRVCMQCAREKTLVIMIFESRNCGRHLKYLRKINIDACTSSWRPWQFVWKKTRNQELPPRTSSPPKLVPPSRQF